MLFLLVAIVATGNPVTELEKFQGTWAGPAGAELVIKGDAVSVRKDGKEEFKGTWSADPKTKRFAIIIGDEKAVEGKYEVEGDRLHLEIDGKTAEYKKRN